MAKARQAGPRGGGRGRNGQEAGGWPVGGLSGCIELHWALVGGGR